MVLPEQLVRTVVHAENRIGPGSYANLKIRATFMNTARTYAQQTVPVM